MVARTPLVLIAGRPALLPSGDTIDVPGGGAVGFADLTGLPADNAALAALPLGMSTVMVPAAGVYIAQSSNGSAIGTVAQVANRTVIAPFMPQRTFSIDTVGISVSTVLAASNAKVVIYASDGSGRPDAVIAESADISCATAGTFHTALSVTFEAGKVYWIGVRASGTQTLRSLTAGAFPVLSYSNAATPAIQTVLTKTETYATPAAAWGYASSQHSNLTVPIVLMRVA